MLERTAAGLESGNLVIQRALPRSTRALPSRTKTSSSCPHRQHRAWAPRDVPATRSPHQTESSPALTRPLRPETSPLLDFLYPKRTHALLRRPFPRQTTVDRRLPYLHSSKSPRCALYSTASHAAEVRPREIPTDTAIGARRTPATRQSRVALWQSEFVEPKKTFDTYDESSKGTVRSFERTAELDISSSNAPDQAPKQKALAEMLDDKEGQLFHDVWDAYIRMESTERDAMRPKVLQYLVKSRSVVETGRAISLFRQVPTEQWNDDFLSSSVLLLVRSGQHNLAIDTFKKGLWEKNLTGGFEYLLLDTMNGQRWASMLDIWLDYCKNVSERGPDSTPDDAPLNPITSLDSLGALYFSFERFLAKNDSRLERWLALEDDSKAGLHILRRRFAVEALKQPCPPQQARTILAFWRDPSLYDRYLWRMFDRWYRKLASTDAARLLPAIYEDYLALPGSKPSHAVMRGIFKVHYPTNITALERLYEDWIRCWGDLNRWGYEKFLKLFAYRGDVERVRELWERYMEQFPEMAGTTRAFTSITNVYAQNGDVAGIERELDRMISVYNVTPDISIWNTLLKCYTRAGNFTKVLSTFRTICQDLIPDSFTYAHVMAMSSKKGDVDQTLAFFNEAQSNGIVVTPQMGLALVVAYCQNGKILEAEGLCRELAQRQITSIAMWNQLLYYNGLKGNVQKCYQILESIKTYNLEWDHETIGYLLQALARVRQVGQAYKIVRDALHNQSHIQQPEHFAIVMMAAARCGDRRNAESLMSMMEKASVPATFNAMVAYTQTALREAPNTKRTMEMGSKLVESLSKIAKSEGGDIRQRRRNTLSLGTAIQLLTTLRDFANAAELLNLFADLFPQYRQGDALPQDAVAALMLAYQKDDNHTQALELWNEAWNKNLIRCSKANGKGIYPAHQYDLTRLVFRLVDTYRARNDGDALLETVEKVVAAGFKLASTTWNRVIRALADLGKWERGMYWCETMLMPGWRGWEYSWPTRAERHRQMNPRVLVPGKQTVLSLQKEWLEARRLGVWSSDVARKLADMERRYPKLHTAFVTSDYDDVPGMWLFRDDIELDQAMDKLLTALPREALQKMEKVLVRRMKQPQPSGKKSREGTSPFLMKGANDSRDLRQAEMRVLKSLLEERLGTQEPIWPTSEE